MDEIILSLVEAVARLNERLNEQQDVARVPGKDGVDGKDGKDGRDGKDAEQLTEAQHKAILVEWLSANKPADGKDGESGKDGRDPTAAEIQLAVDLWFELNRHTLRGADGKDGSDGKDGVDGKDGANGLNGLRGADGKDGTGIALIEQRDEKSFWITLDDGREYQIDLPVSKARFISGGGGGGGLTKAQADTLYAPIGSTGDSLALVAAEPILANKLVTTDSTGQVIYGDAGTLAHWNTIIGLSLNAAPIGGLVAIEDAGIVSNSGWSWTAGDPLFVGLVGDITTAQVGVFSQTIGYAISATQVFLRLGRAVARS